MAVFAYRAWESESAAAASAAAVFVSGTIVADTPRQARDLLRERGLTIEQIQLQQPHGRSGWGLSLWGAQRQRHGSEVQALIDELATLLAVGTPLLEALDTVAAQHRGRFRSAVLMLRERVSAGVGLAQAMREQPLLFDELCVNMTEVGENAGTLDTVLQRLAEFQERASQLKGRIGTALLYPGIVLLTGVAVSLFLMSFVVPNLLEALVQAGRPLPLVTRLVKGASDLLVQRWWLLLAGLAGGLTASGLLLRSRRGRRLWHRLQLRLPLLGQLVRKQAVVRIATVLATLLKSGMVLPKALQIAQRSVANQVLREALVRCEQAISAGQDIAQAIGGTGAFPPVVVQVFAVGQQSGKLEEMLEKLAGSYDRQLTSAAQRLTAVLEPVLILLLALFVGFIAFATVLPILEAGHVL